MKIERKADDRKQPSQQKAIIHIIWGVALILAGIGVFFRIPQVMPKIETIKQFSSVLFFIKFCFYLIGSLLVWGGAKKVYANHRMLSEENRDAKERR